jgi:tRNA A37 N6-isopentenylltransferase MiaA
MNNKRHKDFEKVVKTLRTTSVEKPITSYRLLDIINRKRTILNYLIDSELRVIVHDIRKQGVLPVISGKSGYYVSYDEEEIKRVYDSLMNRSLAIQEAAVALKIHFLS